MSEEKHTVPKFNGHEKNFIMWWKRFCQYAVAKRFREALSTTAESRLLVAYNTTLDAMDPAQKEQIDARERNNMVCVAIGSAMLDDMFLAVEAADDSTGQAVAETAAEEALEDLAVARRI